MQRRLTDDEESHLRAAWSVLQKITKPWEEISRLQRAIWEMVANSTTNGLRYIEPPLTDEDAKQRPWVAVWDERQNNIPNIQRLVHVAEALEYRFSVANSCGSVTRWKNCRRATAEEIAAAGMETPDA
jgi:hypothetical protein